VVNRNKLLILSIGLHATLACSGDAHDVFAGGSIAATAGAGGTSAAVGSTGSTGQGPTGGATTAAGSSTAGAAPESTSTTAGSTGAGGAAGAAGAGGGGADAGPSDGPHSACDGKTRKITSLDPFIADFESGDMHGWYDFGATGALNLLTDGAPGAIGTARAGHLAAAALTSFGAGMGFGTGCWDVSSLDGVSFWAKGSAGVDNAVQFQVAIPATHGVQFGGDCVAQCNDHPSKKLMLTPQWKQYAVAFKDLTQAGFGTPAQYSGVMMALNWVSLSGPAVDFWIDEVALYAGKPSTEPVGRNRPDAGQ
jgi:hypothetical protein